MYQEKRGEVDKERLIRAPSNRIGNVRPDRKTAKTKK